MRKNWECLVKLYFILGKSLFPHLVETLLWPLAVWLAASRRETRLTRLVCRDSAFLVRDLNSFRVFLSFLLSFFPMEGRKSVVERRRTMTNVEDFIALQLKADRRTDFNYLEIYYLQLFQLTFLINTNHTCVQENSFMSQIVFIFQFKESWHWKLFQIQI